MTFPNTLLTIFFCLFFGAVLGVICGQEAGKNQASKNVIKDTVYAPHNSWVPGHELTVFGKTKGTGFKTNYTYTLHWGQTSTENDIVLHADENWNVGDTIYFTNK